MALHAYIFLLEDFQMELEIAEFSECLPNPVKEQTLEDDVLDYLRINKGVPQQEVDISGITLLKQSIVRMSAENIEDGERPEETIERFKKIQSENPVIYGYLKALEDYVKLAYESGLIE